MKQWLQSLVLFILPVSLIFAEEEAKVEKEETYDIQTISRSFGHMVAGNIRNMSSDFDLHAVAGGIQDYLKGTPAPLDEGKCVQQISKIQEQSFKKQADANLAAAETFLTENRKKPNMVILEEGKLQYSVLQTGKGAEVVEHSKPVIRYKGTFLDGKVFGQSEEEPIELDSTVPGFSKGLIGMKEGEKRQLFIHPELAFGSSGFLPPNSLVSFEIEVVKADSPKEEPKDEPADDEAAEEAPSETNSAK